MSGYESAMIKLKPKLHKLWNNNDNNNN